jgi:hypothetical protein
VRHPSKVGAFCARKLARGASDNVLGRGGPPRSGLHLTRGPAPRTTDRVTWFERIRASRIARGLFKRKGSADQKVNP